MIGASGFVGSAILKELLSRGHQITAIVRNPEKIASAENLNAASVDVLNETALTKAVAGQDAVISAYNAGWQNPNLYTDFLKGSQAIQQAVKKAGVKRLIVVGVAGSLFIVPGSK